MRAEAPRRPEAAESEAALARRPRVKICGIRSGTDLERALAAGADALGFIVGARHRTEAELSPAAAADLVRCLPPFVSSVMVTHRQEPGAILALADQVRPSVLQLQDAIDPGALQTLRSALPATRLVVAVHVIDADAIPEARRLAPLVDALLLDSRTADRIGGTGVPHDWSISRRIVEAVQIPVILAGGLQPGNLAEAIARVRPAAVDVNTGVENAAGEKDPQRLQAFVRIARQGMGEGGDAAWSGGSEAAMAGIENAPGSEPDGSPQE